MDGHVDRPRRGAWGEAEGAKGHVVVGAGGRGDVGGRIVDGHGAAARRREGHREAGHAGPGDGLDDREVGDGEARRVVVQDRPLALRVTQGGIDRAREVDDERLVGLEHAVAEHAHAHRLARGPRREDDRRRPRNVVRPGRGRAVGGRVVDSHDPPTGGGERDGEAGDRRPRVAFRDRDVVDRNRRRRVVVVDRARALSVRDEGSGGAGEVHEEGFVRLVQEVADHLHRDRTRGRTHREGERPGRRGVVSPRSGRAGGSGVVDRHRLPARGREAHREDGVCGPAVALGHGHVVDGEGRLLEAARAAVTAPARSPQHTRVRGARQVVGHDAAGDGADDHLEVGIGVDVGEGGRAETAVLAGADRGGGQRHPVQLDPHRAEDVQVAHPAGALLRPGGEDHLGLAVVVEVGHHRLAGEAERVAVDAGRRHDVGPAPVLGLVQPVGVQLPVVGREEDLELSVPVQVGGHGVRHRGLDHVVVLGARPAAGAGARDGGPVEAAAAPARPVEAQEERHLVEGGVGVGAAVVDVAHHDPLARAVPVDVREHGRAVREVRPVLDAAVRVPAQVHRVVHVDADLAPDLRPHRADVVVDRVRRELVAVAVEGGDVMGVGGAEDFPEAVAVHVGHGHVLVVHAPAVAGLAHAAGRPARAHGPVRLVDAELLRVPSAPTTHDDLEGPVAFEVRHRESSDLAAPERVSRPEGDAEAVVDRELIAPAAHDHLEGAVAGQVRDDDTRPHPLGVRGAPLETPGGPVQGDDVVGSPDDVRLAIAVEVRDRGGGVPARLAVGAGDAAAVAPFENGSGNRGEAGQHVGQPRDCRECEEASGAHAEWP